MKAPGSYLLPRRIRPCSQADEVVQMAIHDKKPSDAPVEKDTHRCLEPASVVGQDLRPTDRFDKPFTAISVIHALPGRVRLRVPLLRTYSHLGKGLQALLSAQAGVIEATVNTRCNSVTVVYESTVWNADALCRFLQDRNLEEVEESASAALSAEATGSSSINWLQPWRFLNAAEPQAGQPVKSGYWTVGYYSMIVGAILVPVPLVPGIPFLILSSYCFAKATIWKEEEKSQGAEQLPKARDGDVS